MKQNKNTGSDSQMIRQWDLDKLLENSYNKVKKNLEKMENFNNFQRAVYQKDSCMYSIIFNNIQYTYIFNVFIYVFNN